MSSLLVALSVICALEAQANLTLKVLSSKLPPPSFCSIITEVGPGVQRLQVGDRVALEPGVPCWSNKACREGRYNLCPDIKFFATPPHHGSLMQVHTLLPESLNSQHPKRVL